MNSDFESWDRADFYVHTGIEPASEDDDEDDDEEYLDDTEHW